MEGRGRDPGRQDRPPKTHATRLQGIKRLLHTRLLSLRVQPPYHSPQHEAHLEMTRLAPQTASFVGFMPCFFISQKSYWDVLPPEMRALIWTWKEVAELQGPRDIHRKKLSIVHAEMNILNSFLYCGLCDQLHHDLIPVWFKERYGPHRITWTALRLQREGKLPPTLNITKLYLKS